MENKTNVLDGYQFASNAEYDRAKKEKELITYLKANTDMADGKAILKIYNRSVEKGSFQSVIGLQFLYDLREGLIESGIVSEEILEPISVTGKKLNTEGSSGIESEQIAHYREKYENALANRRIKNLLIGVFAVVIIGMVIITVRSKYTVFTYFTDYENDIRNKVIYEMEEWQEELDAREKELEQKEQKEAETD